MQKEAILGQLSSSEIIANFITGKKYNTLRDEKREPIRILKQ